MLFFTSCYFDENKNDQSVENINAPSGAAASSSEQAADNTKNFSNKDFSEVEIQSTFEVTLVQAANHVISAKGNADDLEKIEVIQNGKILPSG